MRSKKGLTAKDITAGIFKHFHKKSKWIIESIYLLFDSESDVVTMSKAGYITEYEVKVTLSDFKRDMVKKYKMGRVSERKHSALSSGKTGIKHFYFCAPKDMIPLKLIPRHAGLMEFWRQGGGVMYKIVKRAPALVDATKASPKMEKKIITSMKWKYMNKVMKR